MNVRLRPVRRLPQGQWGPVVALLVWGALVAAAIQIGQTTGEAIPTCHFKHATGVPCPTCGGTRAVMRAGEGDVLGAFLANPMLVAILIGLTFLLGLRFIGGRAIDLGLTARQRRVLLLVALGAVLLNWIYVISFVG